MNQIFGSTDQITTPVMNLSCSYYSTMAILVFLSNLGFWVVLTFFWQYVSICWALCNYKRIELYKNLYLMSFFIFEIVLKFRGCLEIQEQRVL